MASPHEARNITMHQDHAVREMMMKMAITPHLAPPSKLLAGI
jgi:hypothetical protein